MRRIVPEQLGLVPRSNDHIYSRELQEISRILEEHPEAAKWVHQDLISNEGGQVSEQRGREGMTGEQVLRVIVVKQLGGFSYDELTFHLADSISYQHSVASTLGTPSPKNKTLQRNVKKTEALTLERINVGSPQGLVGSAIAAKNRRRQQDPRRLHRDGDERS